MSSRASAVVVVLLSFLGGGRSAVLAQTIVSGNASGQRATAGTVFGSVYDSVAGAPLVRAVVQMRLEAGTDIYTTTSDSAGRYELRDVPPGSYLATFFHPALDALGLEPLLHRVQVDSGHKMRLDFAVPASSTVWALTCQPTNTADSTGLLLGHVRDAETDAPVAGAQVTARWTELLLDPQRGLRTAPREVTTETNDAGLYAICGVPGDGGVAVEVRQGSAASGVVSVTVPARGLRQAAITVSDANTRVVLETDSAGLGSGTVLVRGTARLAGTVRSSTGAPMRDVEVRVLGTGVQGQTTSDGTFLLTDLPAGTHTLAARRLGLAPERVLVNLTSGRTTRVAVTVREAVVLSATTIYGKAHASRAMERLAGFLHRKRVEWGHFITREDIERRQPFNTTDLFQAMLGVRIIRSGFDYSIMMQGIGGYWCTPKVFLDGFSFPLNGGGGTGNVLDSFIVPEDLAAVEVYPRNMLTPAQFRDVNDCGSIVLWSRYAFPYVKIER